MINNSRICRKLKLLYTYIFSRIKMIKDELAVPQKKDINKVIRNDLLG